MRWIYFLDGANLLLFSTGVLMSYTSDEGRLVPVVIFTVSIFIATTLSIMTSRLERKHRERIRRINPHQHAQCIYIGGLRDDR